MSPKILLRIASVSLGLIFLGHTAGLLAPKSRGLTEDAVFAAMKNYDFEIMGVTRSHWQFYQGSSMAMSLFLIAMTVLMWQLSSLTASSSLRLKPLLIPQLIALALFTILCWTHFFAAPAVCATLATICIGLAVALPSKAQRSARH